MLAIYLEIIPYIKFQWRKKRMRRLKRKRRQAKK